MGIILQEITENAPQQGDYRYISYHYVFHNGDEVYFYSMSKPDNYDVGAGLIEYAAKAEDQVIEEDESKLFIQIEADDLDPLDAEPAHPNSETVGNRKKRFRRKLLRQITSEADLKVIRKIFYPVWYWLKYESGYTAQQIADYLNISMSVLGRINDRFQALHDNLTFVDTDDSYLGEVD